MDLLRWLGLMLSIEIWFIHIMVSSQFCRVFCVLRLIKELKVSYYWMRMSYYTYIYKRRQT